MEDTLVEVFTVNLRDNVGVTCLEFSIHMIDGMINGSTAEQAPPRSASTLFF